VTKQRLNSGKLVATAGSGWFGNSLQGT